MPYIDNSRYDFQLIGNVYMDDEDVVSYCTWRDMIAAIESYGDDILREPVIDRAFELALEIPEFYRMIEKSLINSKNAIQFNRIRK